MEWVLLSESLTLDDSRMGLLLRAKRLAMLGMALNLFAGAMGVFLVGGSYPLVSPVELMSLLFLTCLVVLGLALYIPSAVRDSTGERSDSGPDELARTWAWRSLLSVDLLAAFGGVSVFLMWGGMRARPLLVVGGMVGVFVLGTMGFVVLRGRLQAGWAWGFTLVLGGGPFVVQGISRYGLDERGSLGLVLLLYPVAVPVAIAVDLLLLDGVEGEAR